MNSNQSNHSDGSYHIYVDPPKKKPKPLPKVEIKEVKKNDQKANRK